MKEWKYAVCFHKDGDVVELYKVPFWVTAVEQVLDNRPILLLVGYVPGAYGLFSKLIFWLDNRREVIARIPADAELLAKVAPDDEWLWGEDEGSEDADSEPASGR